MKRSRDAWANKQGNLLLEQSYESGKILMKKESVLRVIRGEMKALSHATGEKDEDKLFTAIMWGLSERILDNTDWKRGR